MGDGGTWSVEGDRVKTRSGSVPECGAVETTRVSGLPHLVDAHVHFHPCFGVDDFFDAASRNFSQARLELGLGKAVTGVLLFADPEGWDSFGEFRHRMRVGRTKWALAKTDEQASFIAFREGHRELVLVPGRQVVSRERLEILVLACSEELRDGAPFGEILKQAMETNYVTLIPWGLGKWHGRRGRLVRTAIESRPARNLFLGDNGGRLHGTPTPGLLLRGMQHGIWNLPGSDPLPFRSQQTRVGSRGFVLQGDVDRRRPAQTIRRALGELDTQPVTFGRGMGAVEFVASQLRIQVQRRLRCD